MTHNLMIVQIIVSLIYINIIGKFNYHGWLIKALN